MSDDYGPLYEEVVDWEANKLPNESYWQYIARKEREILEANYPFQFFITHEGEGGKTSDSEWRRMADFFDSRDLKRGQDYEVSGDGIGYSNTIWIKNPDIATLFKLSFELG